MTYFLLTFPAGSKGHDNVATVNWHGALAGRRGVAQRGLDPVEYFLPQVLVAQFSTVEPHDDPDGMPSGQEPLGGRQFNVQVVVADARPKIEFFLRVVRTLLLLFGQMILVLAVIHDLADNRITVRGYLYEVQLEFLRPHPGLLDEHDPKLFAIGANDPNGLLAINVFVATKTAVLRNLRFFLLNDQISLYVPEKASPPIGELTPLIQPPMGPITR